MPTAEQEIVEAPSSVVEQYAEAYRARDEIDRGLQEANDAAAGTEYANHSDPRLDATGPAPSDITTPVQAGDPTAEPEGKLDATSPEVTELSTLPNAEREPETEPTSEEAWGPSGF